MGFRSDKASIADRAARALIKINGPAPPRPRGQTTASGLLRPVERALTEGRIFPEAQRVQARASYPPARHLL